MSNTNDGGPAFPNTTGIRQVSEHEHSMDGGNGMSLRDYFAAQALPGAMSVCHEDDTYEQVAQIAYSQADAMLAVRAKAKP